MAIKGVYNHVEASSKLLMIAQRAWLARSVSALFSGSIEYRVLKQF